MAQTFLQPKFIGTKDKVLKFNNNLQLEAVYAEISGIQPQIVVYADTGSTVTCSKDGLVLTGVEDNGKWVFNIPSTGIWTCTGTNPLSVTRSENVNVTVIKQYTAILVFT